MGGAAILMYHRIGSGRLPDREVGEHHYAVAPDVFEAQLDTLTSSGASAVPVDVCVDGTRALPPRAVAITFDDGNASDHAIALDALRRRGLRAAFFVTPAWIGRPGYMSWAEVRDLRDAGMTVGAHGLDHTLLATLDEVALREHLREARSAIEAGLGEAPRWLALPGGLRRPTRGGGGARRGLRAGLRLGAEARPRPRRGPDPALRHPAWRLHRRLSRARAAPRPGEVALLATPRDDREPARHLQPAPAWAPAKRLDDARRGRMSLEAVFWLAAAAVFYSYGGYPLLLALAARLRPAPPVRRGDEAKPLSVVIVAHNEQEQIGRKLDNCLSLDYPPDRLEVLVASDGSTDLTEEIVERRVSERVRLLRLPGPAGKPSALNAAAAEARGEILLLCDARQELDRGAARALVANFADPSVGAVSGELLFRPSDGSAGLEGVGLYWTYEKWIRRTESRFDSTVGVTGAICAMRRALYRPLDPRTILDDVALPMSVAQAGYRVVFEPAAIAYDRAPEDPRKEYRRKVRTLAGNYQLVALRPDLLNPFRNRLFFQLVSHKLSRLAVPWCLLLMLGVSGVLAARGSLLFAWLLAAQCAFYLMAWVGWWLKRGGRAVRLLSVPYSLTLLNIAAAEAFFGFLLGREGAAWRMARR